MTNIHSDKILILDFGAQYAASRGAITEIRCIAKSQTWDHDPARSPSSA